MTKLKLRRFLASLPVSYQKSATARMLRIGRWSIAYHSVSPLNVSRPGCLLYRCNICGALCETKVGELAREEPSCFSCGSTVRTRSIIHLLSTALFGKSLILADWPLRSDIRGIGLTDWDGYAIPLAQKLNYQNTYYDRSPRLDIACP